MTRSRTIRFVLPPLSLLLLLGVASSATDIEAELSTHGGGRGSRSKAFLHPPGPHVEVGTTAGAGTALGGAFDRKVQRQDADTSSLSGSNSPASAAAARSRAVPPPSPDANAGDDWRHIISTQVSPPSSSSSTPADDWLRDWLRQLVVTIPPQTVSQSYVTVTLAGLTCSGFAVQSLTSVVDLPGAGVELAVEGAGCQCSGTWAVGTMRGGLTAVVGNSNARFRLSLTPPGEGEGASSPSPFPSSSSSRSSAIGAQGDANADAVNAADWGTAPPSLPPQLPTDAVVDACVTTVQITELLFTGSGAAVLRALAPLLKSVVGRELNTALCSSLAASAAHHLSGVMKACDAAVVPRLRQPPPLPDPSPPIPPEVFFDWRRAPAVSLAGFLAASFARADGRFGLDALVDLLTAETGAGSLDSTLLPGGAGSNIPPLEFDVPAAGTGGGGVVGRVTVALHSASLRGLDTVNVLEGPSAFSPTLLTLGLGAEWINFTARATINVTTGGDKDGAGTGTGNGTAGVSGPPLVERVTLEASMRLPVVRARVAAALDEVAVTGLTLQQRAAPGCFAAAVGTLEVNALSFTGKLHHLRLTPDRPGGLEGDVDQVVADVAALLAGRYAQALTAAAAAAAGGPGRDAANVKIAALLQEVRSKGCPAPDAAAAGREALKTRVSLVAMWAACTCIGGAVVAAVAAAVAAPCLRQLRRRLRRVRIRTQLRESLLRRTRSWEAGGGLEAALIEGREDAHGNGDEDEDGSTPLLRNFNEVNQEEAGSCPSVVFASDGGRRGCGRNNGTGIGAVAVFVIPKSPGDGDPARRDGDGDGDGDSDGSDVVYSDSGVGESDTDSEVGHEDDVSLACSTRVPQWVKWALPLALVGNIVLFVSSNTAVGAAVMLSAELQDVAGASAGAGGTGAPRYPNVPLTLPPLFEFTLANSVKDMWQAKVYPLSVLIAVFSGGWPYLKLALMLVAWVVPPRLMAVPRRGRLLGALDALGKWSLIDSFVMTLFMVAFRFHIETQPMPGAEAVEAAREGSWATAAEAIAVLDVTVEPRLGFYSFLLASVLSLVLGHITLGWHRAALESAAKGAGAGAAAAAASPFSAVATQHVALWRRLKGGRRYRLFAGVSVATCLAASAALVVIGARATSLRFDFKGLAGAVLGSSAAHRNFSLLSLASGLPGASSAPHSAGVVLIQAALYVFALAMPLAQLASLAVLWLAPLSRSAQLRIATVAEVAGAWAALDVFLVAAFAAVLQIRQFAAFIVGDSCDTIDTVLRYVAQHQSGGSGGLTLGDGGVGGGGSDPLDLRGDNVCFDVDTRLDDGCWILVPAAVVAVVIGHVVTEACQSVLRRPLQELALTPRATPQRSGRARDGGGGWSGGGGRASAEGGRSKRRWRRQLMNESAVEALPTEYQGEGGARGQSSSVVSARLAAAADELDSHLTSIAAAATTHEEEQPPGL